MKRRVVTPEAQARADRIAEALSGLLDEPSAEATVPSSSPRAQGDPYRPVPRAPKPRVARVDLACPGCRQALVLHYDRGAEIHRCVGCHALWLGPGDLEEMVEPPPPSVVVSVEAIRQQVRAVAPKISDTHYRGCPRCHAPMNRRNFGDLSGVIVDECARHGVFLDPGEFEAIETFIRLGGLKAQRDSLQERTRLAKERRARTTSGLGWLLEHRTRYWWERLL